MTEEKQSKKRLTADEILALRDTTPEEFYVEQWDTTVTIIGLTKRQQLDIRKASIVDGDINEELVQQAMVQQAVIEPRFTEEQMGALFEKNAGAIDGILKRVLTLSGMREEDVKDKKQTFRP